jgi:hypothetical protein
MLKAIARDINRPVEIRMRMALSDAEVGWLQASIPSMASDFVQSGLGQAFGNPATLIQFLSTPQGQEASKSAEAELHEALATVRTTRECRLNLTIDPTGQGRGEYGAEQLFVRELDQRHPPYLTSFSYFPADRAIPFGEQGLQFGAADANAQVESHNSQPQTKYSRFKNTIFATVLESEESRNFLIQEFNRIFGGILRGRELRSIGVNEIGLFSIVVRDVDSGLDFDFDGMSSGEKGLILTFLLIARTIAEDGVILLDEPELHLNPAVCRDVLAFLIKSYIGPKHLQAIVCSHSPEILAGAFDQDECEVFHLESEVAISPVGLHDEDEVGVALSRLGSSEGEGLLYRATIFLEGDSDVELLQVGFSDLLRRYKLRDLGGRREVEKQIRALQKAEQAGTLFGNRYFIFDLDDEPTGLRSSNAVRVLQWDRRCVENYLLDGSVLKDILCDKDMVANPVGNHGAVNRLIRDTAFSQIDDTVARIVYNKYALNGVSFSGSGMHDKSIEEIADDLSRQLASEKQVIGQIEVEDWRSKFIDDCLLQKKRMAAEWEARWIALCDGKRVFADIGRSVKYKTRLSKVKEQTMLRMTVAGSDGWKAIQKQLAALLK